MISEFVIRDSTIYLRYREALHAVLPHGKVIDVPQGKVLAVPHGVDEVKVLRNMGIDVTAAIFTEYDWCGGKPFGTQALTSAFITQNPRCFVTSGMGSGKTSALLYAYDYLRKKGLVNKLLVVAPLSTLNPTWQREVMVRTPHLRVQVLRGTKEQRLKILALPADVYVINHDGVAVVLDALLKRLDIDMVALDEITAYKNARSARSKIIHKLCDNRKRVVGMTGTPVSNHMLDAYGQLKAVLGRTFRMTFTAFREAICIRSGPFKWVPRDIAPKTIATIYQPNIRFTRDETYDLPPCTTITRDVALTPMQMKLLKELRAEGAAILESEGMIKGVNEAALLGKMLQVVLGGVYGVGGNMLPVDAKPRYEELLDILEQLDGRAIIFAPFKETVRQLQAAVGSEYKIGVITGDVPPSARDEVFSLFQGGRLDHLIAHPQTMSHGLTLTEANTVIWFGPPRDLEMYDQANARVRRMGQSKNQLIIRMVASNLERKIFARMERNASLQGLVLDLLQEMDVT